MEQAHVWPGSGGTTEAKTDSGGSAAVSLLLDSRVAVSAVQQWLPLARVLASPG